MKVAMYVRVSTQRQAQTQTIEQQLEQLVSTARPTAGSGATTTFFGMMVTAGRAYAALVWIAYEIKSAPLPLIVC
jgi:hypothetical protein